MSIDPLENNRILVIDDNRAIHDDFRKILIRASRPDDLEEDEETLFGDTTVKFQMPIFEIDSAYQGQEGLNLIEKSLLNGRPCLGLCRCSYAAGLGWNRDDM